MSELPATGFGSWARSKPADPFGGLGFLASALRFVCMTETHSKTPKNTIHETRGTENAGAWLIGASLLVEIPFRSEVQKRDCKETLSRASL